MKVAVEVDAEVLEDAMKVIGAQTREAAAASALKRMSERKWNKDVFPLGPIPTPREWREAFSPDYAPKRPSWAPSFTENETARPTAAAS